MRTSAQDAIRNSGLPAWWNGTRSSRNRLRGRARGLLRAPVASSVGYGFGLGRGVYLGVAPGAELHIGDQVTLYDYVRLNVEAAAAVLSIGDRTFLNYGTHIFCRENVAIGAGSAIAAGCIIFDNNLHTVDGVGTSRPVRIGDHVWLGANVTVLPGVTIGDGAVVGAGSLVSRDLPGGMLSVGSPARPLREAEWAP